jgi:hypothetical protein
VRPWRRLAAVAALLTALGASAGCSDDGSGPTSGTDTDADADTGTGGDTGGDTTVDSTDETGTDADTGADTDTGGDTDTGADTDTGTDSGAESFGAPCTRIDQCDTSFCLDFVDDGQGGRCSLRCERDDQCPEGFVCASVSGSSADVIEACVAATGCWDDDGDGFGLGELCEGADCDDTRDDVNPQAPEVCDNADNDCDRLIDDTPTDANLPCDTGFLGACAAGRTVCGAGLISCEAELTATDEVCDDRDNDCDGAIDEDLGGAAISRTCYDGPEGTLDQGACRAGVQTCTNGAFTACVGSVLPAPESCDGNDNDCDGSVDEDGGASQWWADNDGDGFGDGSQPSVAACSAPAGRVSNALDCDDANPLAFPGASELPGNGIDESCDGRELCYTDTDGDGFRGTTTVESTDRDCSDPGEASEATDPGDCDDLSGSVRPDATEIPGDELDQDCDGTELCYADADNDGYRLNELVSSPNLSCGNAGEAGYLEPLGDCDDADGLRFPGQLEACNGVDDNCNGTVDEGADVGLLYPDRDGDGYGDFAEAGIPGCVLLAGYVGNRDDCDDQLASVNPGASEVVGNGVDEDCNGTDVCFTDGDADGYRGTATVDSADLDCLDAGEASRLVAPGDCDDSNALIVPGAEELAGDLVDQDCDGVELCFIDADSDGFRTSETSPTTILRCDGAGLALARAPSNDCNDRDSSINPSASESCDGVDEDCDGIIDNGVPTVAYYPDIDGDGFGDRNAAPLNLCQPPSEGYVTDRRDCLDTDADIYPGGTEYVGDGLDGDCNNQEVCYVDADSDGFRAGDNIRISSDADCSDPGEALRSQPSNDCNDSNASVRPSAAEGVADGVDQNCDLQELCFVDLDNDGYRPNATATVVSFNLSCTDAGEATGAIPTNDCNDNSQVIRPGIAEVCDGVDQDCDGAVDEGCP